MPRQQRIGTPANTDVGPAGNMAIANNALMAVGNHISDDISLYLVKTDGTLTESYTGSR